MLIVQPLHTSNFSSVFSMDPREFIYLSMDHDGRRLKVDTEEISNDCVLDLITGGRCDPISCTTPAHQHIDAARTQLQAGQLSTSDHNKNFRGAKILQSRIDTLV